ncbi:hypothetical protein BGZ54_001223 [Gamsiella multidivaricata]|nr:hypothetical protein BGZ54_001223 [Gamsiella multidivaricata]
MSPYSCFPMSDETISDEHARKLKEEYMSGDTALPVFWLKTVELDAATLWHRNVYHFEIVISEEFACYHVPSLSACHRVLDSLYHEIVPTFLPSQNTTDIWFEFHPPSNDGDQQGAVTAIGAHEQVLRRHPRIARWIDQERQKAQKQRHQQLEEERRIHYSQQQLHQGAGQGEMQYEEEPEEEIEEEEETLEQGRAQGYDFPSFLTQQPVMGPLNTEEPPSSTPLPGLGYLQSCPQLFLSLAEPQQRMQFAALGSTAEHLPAIPEEEEEEGVDQSSMQGILSPPTPGYPMPPLRIRVENMSPGTFQTVLQYLYTRQIGLSDEQLKDVVIYWDDDPEKHHQPCEEARCQEPSSSSAGGGGVEEAGACQTYSPIVLPPLESSSSRVGCVETTGRTLTKGVGPAAFASLQPTFTAPLFNQLDPPYGSVSSMVSSSSVYSFKATSDLTPWISCSCKSRPWLLSTPPVPSTLQPSLGSERMPPHQRMLFTSSWEDLLQAAELFDIKGLKDLAHKAVLMHCEMMTIRTCADFNVMTEVAHNGYYEAKLDLQLGLGEHVLRSFVELYNSPLLTERYERLVFRHDERGDQEQSKAQQGERDFSIVEEMMQVEGEYDEGGGGGGEDIEEQRSTRWADEHLFDNPECEKEILTLCSEIRSSFLRMRETLEGHHE